MPGAFYYFLFVFCNDISIVGSGFLVFLLNRAVTHCPGVPPFLPVLLHAARFTLNPGRNLSTNTTMPTIATRQLFLGASDPHAAHGQRGRFNCRAAFLLPPWPLCTTGLCNPFLCFLYAAEPIIVNVFSACTCIGAFRALFRFLCCGNCRYNPALIIK